MSGTRKVSVSSSEVSSPNCNSAAKLIFRSIIITSRSAFLRDFEISFFLIVKFRYYDIVIFEYEERESRFSQMPNPETPDSSPIRAGFPIMIGDPAPAFTCRTTMGERSLADYRGRWLVLFSHPADFTPVCTSEFVAFAKAQDSFVAIGCDLLGLSIDSLFSHIAWVRSIQAGFGVRISFPVAEDPSMAIARAYGMIHAGSGHSGTVRGCFIIDPNGMIRLILWYPMSVGRNVDEILRAVRALQVSDAHNVLIPEGWRAGDEVILPAELNSGDAGGDARWYYQTRALETAK